MSIEKHRRIICACAEGQERSVDAVEFLKEQGFRCELLPGGLESFEEYILGKTESDDPRMGRLFARGASHASDIRVDYNSKYNRLLKYDDALWLIFISKGAESHKLREILQKLKQAYGVEIKVLN